MNRFEKANATYHDPKTSEFDKGVAMGVMQELSYQTQLYNKVNNPAKYHEDQAKKAKERAEFHEKQSKKSKK